MRSRYNTEGSIDYEADREIELLRHVDAELERLRRVDAETGGADGCIGDESLFKPTVKLLRKAGHLGAPVGDIARMTQMAPLSRTVDNFLKRFPTDKRVPRIVAILERIESTPEWTTPEAVSLLDDLTLIYEQLVEWASVTVAADEEDWDNRFRESAMGYNPTELFDPEELVRLSKLVKVPDQNGSRKRAKIRRLLWLICRAGAEKDTRFRYLLDDAELKQNDDPFNSIALGLAAYDYSVNGTQTALQFTWTHSPNNSRAAMFKKSFH